VLYNACYIPTSAERSVDGGASNGPTEVGRGPLLYFVPEQAQHFFIEGIELRRTIEDVGPKSTV